MMRALALITACCVTAALPLAAQRPTLSNSAKAYVAVDAPVVALTHARVVDGTGAPARDDQTILITGDRITAVGKTGSVSIPADARTIDLTGRTVMSIV